MGSTAQLQFYDWEPNVLGDRGPEAPYAGSKALYEATDVASKQKPKAEQTDVPPGSDESPQEADKKNDSTSDQYYLFGPDRLPIGPDKQPLREGEYEPSGNCNDLLSDYDATDGPANKYAKNTACKAQLEALGPAGPPDGSRVIKVPQGIVVVEAEPAPNQSARVHRFFVIEDDSELTGKEIKNPEQNFDPNTKEPLVTMEFTDKGREAFARVTKRLADRGRDCRRSPASRRTARTCRRARRPTSSSSASRSRSTTRSSRWRRSTSRTTPRASTAAPAPQIENIGDDPAGARTWPRACASAPCRSTSS